MDGYDVFAVHADYVVGVVHVGVYHHVVVAQFGDAANDFGALVFFDDDGRILIGDFLARVDDRFQQIARVEPARHAREVGTNGAAFVVEPVAGETANRPKHFAAAVVIAPFRFAGHGAGQF